VPQPVRSYVGQACPFAGPLDNIANQISADRSPRCPAGQEHMDGIRRIPARGQIGDQRFADL